MLNYNNILPPKEQSITNSKFYFVQPIHSRLIKSVDSPVYEYFNAKYLSYSPSEVLQNHSKFMRTCKSCVNPVFQTNQGFEICPCGKTSLYHREKDSDESNPQPKFENFEQSAKELKETKVDVPITRSSSCDGDYGEGCKKDRRVSILVDELLLKIYGDRDRKFSSCGTDVKDTFDYSTDSSNCIVPFNRSNALLKKKRSFSGIPEDKCQRWRALIRARLMSKSLKELRTLKENLEHDISHTGSQLVRQLRRRDLLFSRRDAQCDIITAFLQAKSPKRSEDTKMQFSMKPSAGESGFQQWHSAMKMVARLPGGIPHEFRKTLWLTLAERHISSKKINWYQVEKRCFNDSTNPDDEELGVQIVKDLHRTGCSLFCGTSGEQNQAVLKRVLLAYARWNKSVGYCQGFNMLAALILEVMDRCEYDSLKVMIYLIEGVLPESYFANSLRGLSIDMAVFRDLLRLKLPELSKHLEQLQTGSNDTGNTYEPPLTNVFTMQWFLTLFCNCLPHSTVLRVWDLVFLEGNQVLLKTALAIWDTLSDRIMPVKSADEFYSIMGVLTREMLEFGLMDANSLVKTITSIELSELTELRERYIYNITPWTQVARKGLRLFYSDDESDDSDEEQNDDKVSEGAYGFLKAATKHGSQSIRSISPSSILSPFASEKDKIALDISALKKQYCKIKERQKQAQIIFTAACNTHGLMGSVVSPTPTPAINHLLLNKPTVITKPQKIQKQPALPMSRAVQRLKESSSSIGDDTSKDRGETVYWDKRVKKKKRKKRDIICSKSVDSKESPENQIDSDSSSSSYSSGSLKSSTSTELCDDITEFDSDNTSLSEYCSSPLHRIQSSSLSLLDDVKTDTAEPVMDGETHDEGMTEAPNRTEFDEGEHILNVLLTTSILVNEQMNSQESSEKQSEPISEEHFSRQLSNDNVLDDIVNNDVIVDNSVCDNRVDSSLLSDSCDVSSTISQNLIPEDAIIDEVSRQHMLESHASNGELDTELEHMKIDALEILFSSSTLESIRNGSFSMNDDSTSLAAPVVVNESDKSDESKSSSFTLPLEQSDKTCLNQLKSTPVNDDEHNVCDSISKLDAVMTDNFTAFNTIYDQVKEPLSNNEGEATSLNSFSDKSFAHGNELVDSVANVANNVVSHTPEEKSINKQNHDFDFSCFETNFSSTFPDSSKSSNDLDESLSKEIANCNPLETNTIWSWENDNFCLGSEAAVEVESHPTSTYSANATGEDEKSSILPFDIFDNQCNLNVQQSPEENNTQNEPDTLISFDSNSPMQQNVSDFVSKLHSPKHELMTSPITIHSTQEFPDNRSEQLNSTETALENILRENTEVLKKVYHKYTYSQSCDFDTVSLHYNDTVSSDGENRNTLPPSRLKTKDIKFLSLDYPVHFEDMKKRPRRKHKSLDSLNTKKSKLKIGLVSKNCKWISISIDNSDLGVFNSPTESKLVKPSYRCDSVETKARGYTSNTENKDAGKKNNLNSSEYLHLNFDIIGTGKKKKDPIQEYVHKKNVLSQNFKSPSELAPLNFNPFPSRSNTRPPKELGVKLGLYSSNKTK